MKMDLVGKRLRTETKIILMKLSQRSGKASDQILSTASFPNSTNVCTDKLYVFIDIDFFVHIWTIPLDTAKVQAMESLCQDIVECWVP
ncbi:hypothetical protein L1887_19176 [Cichorium endivia]|nr:hypothetical protein L1887_19176 [Cichorium endivia]